MSKVCKRCGQPLPDNGLTIYANKHTGRTTEKHESYCKACKKIVRLSTTKHINPIYRTRQEQRESS